jgi:hypothetical protein
LRGPTASEEKIQGGKMPKSAKNELNQNAGEQGIVFAPADELSLSGVRGGRFVPSFVKVGFLNAGDF